MDIIDADGDLLMDIKRVFMDYRRNYGCDLEVELSTGSKVSIGHSYWEHVDKETHEWKGPLHDIRVFVVGRVLQAKDCGATRVDMRNYFTTKSLGGYSGCSLEWKPGMGPRAWEGEFHDVGEESAGGGNGTSHDKHDLPLLTEDGMKQWWEVLGVVSNATTTEIQAAYHEKMKQVHPDVHPDMPGNTEASRRLTEARDEGLRRAEDRVV